MICARGVNLAGFCFQGVNMGQTKIGRPPTLSADDKDLLLEYIAGGMSNTKSCAMMHIEPSTFYLTLGREPDFMERYQAAKAGAVDAIVDEAQDAARDARTAQSGAEVAGIKVFVDTQKWMASRLAPQRWGEKSSVHVTGTISDDPQEMAKRVAFLEALQDGQNDEGPGSDAEPEDAV
jgi:hypothetical protein